MEEDDWQTEHFNNRRISHGRKGKRSAKGGVFDPRRSYGIYQLQCPALAMLPSSAGSPVKIKNDAAALEIHGPVEGRDDALMCSIDMPGSLTGVAILAGSRKVLSSVVQDLEHPEPEEDEEEDKDSTEEEDASRDSDKAEESHEEEQEQEPKSSMELADEKERRRYAAFEKNSFRSPKFWMRWRAVVVDVPDRSVLEAGSDLAPSTGGLSDGHVEVHGGYLVFSGNDCATFSGTISCASYGWKNVKLSGKKAVSKAREAPRGWTDIGVDEA